MYTQKIEDLNYRLNGTIAEAYRSQNIIASLREQLLSVRTDVDKHSQCLPLYTEGFTADISNRCSGFLYSLSKHVKKLVVKHYLDIETTVKTDVEDIDAF